MCKYLYIVTLSRLSLTFFLFITNLKRAKKKFCLLIPHDAKQATSYFIKICYFGDVERDVPVTR